MFADAVKNDNGIVDRVAENCQERRDKKQIDFSTVKMNIGDVKTGRQKHVVSQSDNGSEAIFPRRNRMRNFAKGKSDEKDNAKNNHTDGNHGFAFHFVANGW